MNIVILAAGKGTRMHSDLPKVLHTLAGKPMVAHVLNTARALAPSGLVVVYGYGGEQVRAACADAGVAWALQKPQLGTGHALRQALPLLSVAEQTLVLYGDVPLIGTETLLRLREAAGDGIGVLTVELPDPRGYGRIGRDSAGRIVRIVEEKDASPAEKAISEINTGIMVLPTARLADWLGRLTVENAQREYYLTDVIALAVTDGVIVSSAQPSALWEVQGVNNKLQLAELERIQQRNIANALLLGGAQLADPARIDVRGALRCGRDVTIDVGCVFEGEVVLGDGVAIGPYCVMKNVTVAAGARIAAFSHLEDAQVGKTAVVGPYARLRPGAVLGEGAHVGNFVEIKKATLGAGSKANHLAYIGDATIGQRVNIGAGTITCNYDGVNKFTTVIEDDAFIGSDSQLVAPVRVGAGATLGAGTTLTKDAPPHALTITRPKQLTLVGWQRPSKK
jgi:bifunctional UDP-N-acetylglucosamine pyrophosphorylase / glucosamine-1-phosphate N-acetyltransferase